MLAVQFLGNSKVEVKDMPTPSLKPGEVLLKIEASAICGSEMGAFRSPPPEHTNNITIFNPGHELAGTIAETNDAGTVKVGDRVAINIITGCGKCTTCRQGDRRFCNQQGYVMNAHAEYIAVPAYTCMGLPDDLPFDLGVLIGGDTLGVAYHALSKVTIKPRATALVVGAGPVGSGFVAMLSYLGVRTILVEMSPYRRELMKQYGLETVDPTTTDALTAIKELTNGKGADVSIDASGKDAGVNLALDAVSKKGTMVFAGAGREATINPWKHFLEKEMTAYGVWYFVDNDYYGLLESYRNGLNVKPLLTHHFHLKDAQQAYDLFAGAQAGKVVFVPTGSAS
jgi:threonine dehydrogenase-like Zn-dependent dehydrogenase